jgi:hypothetical protein
MSELQPPESASMNPSDSTEILSVNGPFQTTIGEPLQPASAPPHPINTSPLPNEISRSHIASQVVPAESPLTPSLPSHTIPIPTSPTRLKSTLPEKPTVRRSPSKVPGDYDPVTGYYRRKSDADIRLDEEDQDPETKTQSTDRLRKDEG